MDEGLEEKSRIIGESSSKEGEGPKWDTKSMSFFTDNIAPELSLLNFTIRQNLAYSKLDLIQNVFK